MIKTAANSDHDRLRNYAKFWLPLFSFVVQHTQFQPKMGIQGLLPFVQKACRFTNISEFSGCTVAIDGHCWLHRAIYGCSEKLIKGQTTTQYVTFCMRFIDMLKSYKIIPIMVFDGNALPSKREVHASRQQKKRAMRLQGESLEKDGNFKEARQCYVQSLDITASMVSDVINACKAAGVDYLVAPFEADAQLTYLSNKGIVHLVITEDSDLIPFGCKRIMFKLDNTGNGTFFERRLLHHCLGPRAELLLSPTKKNDEMLFTRFRYACIMSGCDYHPGGLAGVGLLKASKAMLSCSNLLSIDKMLARLPQYLQNMHLTITSDYREKFIRANQTFLHQIVFDPLLRKLVPLTPLPVGLSENDLIHAGHGILSDWDALHMAMGQVKVEYRNSQDQNASQSSQKEGGTPIISQEIPSTAPVTPRKSGIWCSTYKIPLPLESPTRAPLVRRQTTAGQTIVVDISANSLASSKNVSASLDLQFPPKMAADDLKVHLQQQETVLMDFKNSPLRHGGAKRKLFAESGENDEISRPETPPKRQLSYSAPAKKFSRSVVPARLTGREVSARVQLKNITKLTQSSYFSGLSSAPVGNFSQTSDYCSLDSSSDAIVDVDDNEEEIIILGVSPPHPHRTSHSLSRTFSSTTPSLANKKKEVPFKFAFAHLAYKKPA